jgi:hypothetical protein
LVLASSSRGVAAQSSAQELRDVLANQPPFAAEAYESGGPGTKGTALGRLSAWGNCFRFEPVRTELGEDSDAEILFDRGWTVWILQLSDRDPTKIDAFALHPRDKRYVEVSSEDHRDYYFAIRGIAITQPYLFILKKALLEGDALERLEPEKVDGHVCVTIRARSTSGEDEAIFYAAKDLKGLVIKVSLVRVSSNRWSCLGQGALFPGDTVYLRNVSLKVSPSMFHPPVSYARLGPPKKPARRNYPPVCLGMSASRDQVIVGQTVELRADASDPDGDVLVYDWEVPGGRVIGGGSRVTWDTSGVAPGSYSVAVRINDGFEHMDRCSSKITVIAGPTGAEMP